jgi:Protein of unknown function (DUF3185)
MSPAMNATRSIGAILLGLGALLLVLGFSASKSLADNLSGAFLGHLTRETTWYLLGGIASAVTGILLVLGAFGRNRA